MGSILHPVGPLPPGAYWLRRALVLLLVAVAAFGAVRLVGRGGSTATTGTPLQSSSPNASPVVNSASPSPKISPTPKPSVSPKPSASTVSSAAPTACPASAIRVTASTDAASYPSGRKPILTITVTNTGKVACLRNVGQSAVSLTVTAAGVRTWSSEDCAPGGPLGPKLLQPGGVVSEGVSWPRLKSAVGCPAGLPSATPGAYDVVATNDGITSAAVRFILR